MPKIAKSKSSVPKMIPNPEYLESVVFKRRVENFKDALCGMGECIEDYFPEEYGKQLPKEGGWIMLLMSVQVGKAIGDTVKSIVVPHLSIWYATPTTTQMGRKIDGVELNTKQAIIRTLDGDVHVWPHEYTPIDLSKYLEFTEEDGFYIRFLHPETGGFDASKMHYIRSRGISEAQAKRWLLPELNNPNFCYFEFDPEIALLMSSEALRERERLNAILGTGISALVKKKVRKGVLPARHWELPPPRGSNHHYGAFCGNKNATETTEVKQHVTCLRCLRLMELHDHKRRENETPN